MSRPRISRDFLSKDIAPRVVAEFSAKALISNYEAIHTLVPDHSMLPMVKANAYGHGAVWVARNLLHMSGLYGFGVATLEEGKELREELGPKGRRVKIVVCSGAVPWSEEKGQYCEKYGLTPMIATDRDWQTFLSGGWAERIPYELKFNTGMNRLGISASQAPTIARALRSLSATAHPAGIVSHLAMGENPDSRLSRMQREKFVAIKSELSGVCPSALFHLANSAGIWNQKLWGLKGLTDIVRPGISLYGVPPWQGAPERGIAPVMTYKAAVLAVHRLKQGESIGYGGAEIAAPVYAAIVSAGYADGVKRALSCHNPGGQGGGHAWVSGQASRFLGIVSMDLSAVTCTDKTQVGDWVEFMGPRVDAWAQARAAGTIPYELLTSVSSRVERIYG